MKRLEEWRLKEVGERLGFSRKEMSDIQWLAIGPFSCVELRIIPSKLELDPHLQRKIEKKWIAHLKQYPYEFNGALLSVSKIEARREILYITVRPTDYKTYIGTRWKRKKRKLDLAQKPLDRDFPLPLSIGAVTATKDDKIAIGIKKKVGLGKGLTTTLPGGYFDPQKDLNWQDCILREMKEELGIESNFIKSLKVLGLIFDCKVSQQPLLAIDMRVEVESEEIIPKEDEIAQLEFLDNSIEAVRKWRHPWTPHSIGRLILHFALF